MEKFTYGVGNRGASFRIPTSTAHANGQGYIEDRRPASNIDPYLVSAMLVDSGVLPNSLSADLKGAFEEWRVWRRENNFENLV